ncbi:MAG TPA: hypothetical protein VN108_10030 [Marmoricola sp.]|nr:hypothetical protein [Marmoricola sp.]
MTVWRADSAVLDATTTSVRRGIAHVVLWAVVAEGLYEYSLLATTSQYGYFPIIMNLRGGVAAISSAALAVGVVAVNGRLLTEADRSRRTWIAALETVAFIAVAFVMFLLGAELSWLVGADLLLAAVGFYVIFGWFAPGEPLAVTRVRHAVNTAVIAFAALFVSLVLPWIVAALASTRMR